MKKILLAVIVIFMTVITVKAQGYLLDPGKSGFSASAHFKKNDYHFTSGASLFYTYKRLTGGIYGQKNSYSFPLYRAMDYRGRTTSTVYL